MKLIAVILVVLLFGFWGYHLTKKPVAFAGDLNEHVTIVRDGYDLPPLEEKEDLNIIAQFKCEDMVNRKYYGHKNPNGLEVWEQYNFGEYTWAGENIARAYRTAFEVVEGWRNSPTHLENLINPEYKEVGYGVCKDTNGYFYIVQVFRG